MHEVAELVDEQKTKDLVKANEFMIVATIASSNQDDVQDEDNVDTADGKAAEWSRKIFSVWEITITLYLNSNS